MRKIKKALASLAIAGMVLSMAPASIFAADSDTRLAGNDRYATSIKVAEAAYSEATTAVVAAGNQENLVDALAAAPLAAQENAPIYLTNKVNMNDDVINSMMDLGVENVIVVGAAANKAVVDELENVGFAVKQLSGANRVATANAINAELDDVQGKFLVGHMAIADAMSVASYAAANNYAIVVAERDGSAPAGVSGIDYVVGGTGVVKSVAGADRLAGDNRYATNEAVLKALDFKYDNVYLAKGLDANLSDALVASVLAAQTDAPIVLTNGTTIQAKDAVVSNMTSSSKVVALGGPSLVSESLRASLNPSAAGALMVDSVSATAANAIKVKFNKAPQDVEKVEFTVENAGATLTPTVNWNEGKTEATLAYSSNYPNGNYTVKVAESDKELASKQLTFEQQKVAKIEVTSSVLSVDPTTGLGYATYKVLDQYGVDITNLPLANNIQWQPGIGDKEKEPRDGVIVIKPTGNIPLLTYQTVVITAYDPNAYVTTSASLSVSQSAGTISKLTLNKLYSLNDDEFNTSNTTGQWYVDYTALDASGNPTSSYELIKSGVLLNTNSTTFNAGPFVEAEIVQDPKDSKKAAISIRLNRTNISNLVSDMQIPINVILKNGQTASLNVTLKLGARLDSITLYSPTDTVSSGQTVAIPFVAYDQNGKKVTALNKLNRVAGQDRINFSISSSSNGGAVTLAQNADGSARILVSVGNLPSGAKNMPVYVTATVAATGKTSQLNINVQEEAQAATLSINASELTQAMQEGGASQKITFNATTPKLVVKDQYGRNFDMVTSANYKVVAKTTGSAVIISGGTNPTDNGASDPTKKETTTEISKIAEATFTSGSTPGTQVVTFSLVDANNNVLDTKNYSFMVVENDAIVDYAMGSFNELYLFKNTEHPDTQAAYKGDVTVSGKLSNGAKVILAPKVDGVKNTVAGVLLSNNTDFELKSSIGGTKIEVAAKQSATNNTKSATGTVSVMVNGTDRNIHTLTAELTASNAAPVVESISYTASKEKAKVSNDRVTIAATDIDTHQITEFTPAGAKQSTSNFYFSGKDQYGKKAAPISVFVAADNTTGGTGVTIDSDNKLQLNGANSGTFTLTAVSGSGVSKTVIINLQ